MVFLWPLAKDQGIARVFFIIFSLSTRFPTPEADSLNKKVWAQTELWGKSVPDLKIAFFKKSLVLARTKLSMGLARMHSLKKI